MLGKFENFPAIVHKEKSFKTNISLKKVQREIIKAFFRLNGKEFLSNSIFNEVGSGFNVIFEIGIADGLDFNYLDDYELKRCLMTLESRNFKVLDFFVINRYYRVSGKGRRIPLKFDYQLIRFEFSNRFFTIRLYHERGPRRIPLEELIDFLVNNFMNKLS